MLQQHLCLCEGFLSFSCPGIIGGVIIHTLSRYIGGVQQASAEVSLVGRLLLGVSNRCGFVF